MSNANRVPLGIYGQFGPAAILWSSGAIAALLVILTLGAMALDTPPPTGVELTCSANGETARRTLTPGDTGHLVLRVPVTVPGPTVVAVTCSATWVAP